MKVSHGGDSKAGPDIPTSQRDRYWIRVDTQWSQGSPQLVTKTINSYEAAASYALNYTVIQRCVIDIAVMELTDFVIDQPISGPISTSLPSP